MRTRTCKFNLNCPKPVQPMAPAAVEVDLGVGAGAAAGELEAGWSGGKVNRGQPLALKWAPTVGLMH